MVLERWSGMAGVIGDLLRDATIELVQRARAKPLERARTLAEFWKLHHKPYLVDARTNTRAQHVVRWETWIDPELGAHRWRDLTPQRVGAWITWLRGQHCFKDPTRPKLSANWIIAISTTLSAILEHATALEYLAINPCTAAGRYLPEGKNTEAYDRMPRALDLFAAAALISVATDPQHAFAIFTCSRPGEIRGLRWRCMHDGDPVPWVNIEASDNGPTKGGKARSVPLHPDLAPLMIAWRTRWRARYLRDPGAEDFVFPDARGGKQSRPQQAQRLTDACERAGIPRITPHKLRHTGATLYRRAGVHKENRDAMLGHAGSQQISDLYAPPDVPTLYGEIQRLRGVVTHGSRGTSTAPSTNNEKKFDLSRANRVHVSGMRPDTTDARSVLGRDLFPEHGEANSRSVAEQIRPNVLDDGLALDPRIGWDDFGYPITDRRE